MKTERVKAAEKSREQLLARLDDKEEQKLIAEIKNAVAEEEQSASPRPDQGAARNQEEADDPDTSMSAGDSAPSLDDIRIASTTNDTPEMVAYARHKTNPADWVGSVTGKLEVWRRSRSTGEAILCQTCQVLPKPEQGNDQKITIYERDFFQSSLRRLLSGRTHFMYVEVLREFVEEQRTAYAVESICSGEVAHVEG